MARKKKPPVDLGDPDFMPAQLISGTTPEERDGEVAARIRDEMIKLLNAMGSVPDIAEGDVIPDIELMGRHYDTLGVLLQKMQQRLERHNPPPKASAKRSRKTSAKKASIASEFD